MVSANRRIAPRFHIPIPVSFRRLGGAPDGERYARAIEVSTTGVYFTTDVYLRVAERIEILLNIPWEISGINTTTRRFVGRVTRVDPKDSNEVKWGVGVQLLYWERDSAETSEFTECPLRPVLHNCVQNRAA
jgi:hypothetical protein